LSKYTIRRLWCQNMGFSRFITN